MLRISIYSSIIALLSIACQKPPMLKRAFHYTFIQNDSIRSFNDSTFLALKNIPNDSIYIINFWAKRSQKSLKNRALLNTYHPNNCQVIQINIDYKTTLPKIQSSFKENDFYYKPSSFSIIDSSWNGLLPITLLITKDTLIFEEDLLLNPTIFSNKLELLKN